MAHTRFPEWLKEHADGPPDSALTRLAMICERAHVIWPQAHATSDDYLKATICAIKAIHMEHEGRPSEPGVDEAVKDTLDGIGLEESARTLFRTGWARWLMHLNEMGRSTTGSLHPAVTREVAGSTPAAPAPAKQKWRRLDWDAPVVGGHSRFDAKCEWDNMEDPWYLVAMARSQMRDLEDGAMMEGPLNPGEVKQLEGLKVFLEGVATTPNFYDDSGLP